VSPIVSEKSDAFIPEEFIDEEVLNPCINTSRGAMASKDVSFERKSFSIIISPRTKTQIKFAQMPMPHYDFN